MSKTKNVLCVEDEQYISELYDRALSSSGYNVKTVADGLEAYKLAQKNHYDIILLDLMIPNMTGVDILNKLKKKKTKSKIIVITNLEQRDEDRQKIIDQADGYLVKAEITPHELVEYIDKL